MTLLDTLHITYDVVTPEHVEMSMPISEEIYQPHGFLHGGIGKTGTESRLSRQFFSFRCKKSLYLSV